MRECNKAHHPTLCFVQRENRCCKIFSSGFYSFQSTSCSRHFSPLRGPCEPLKRTKIRQSKQRLLSNLSSFHHSIWKVHCLLIFQTTCYSLDFSDFALDNRNKRMWIRPFFLWACCATCCRWCSDTQYLMFLKRRSPFCTCQERVMLLAYIAYLFFQLKTRRQIFEPDKVRNEFRQQ